MTEDLIKMISSGLKDEKVLPEEDPYDQFEVVEEIINGVKQTRMVPKQKNQKPGGFIEETDPEVEDVEETEEIEKIPVQEVSEEIKTSTDYYFNALIKKGLVAKDGKQVIKHKKAQQEEQKPEVPKTNMPNDVQLGPFQQWVDYNELAKNYNLHMFNDGQTALAFGFKKRN